MRTLLFWIWFSFWTLGFCSMGWCSFLPCRSYGEEWHEMQPGNKTVTMDNLTLPQFEIGKMDDSLYGRRVITLSTGNYSRLRVKFVFNRNIGFYMIQIFVPSMLIVVISWVSFWLSRDAAPARVALGVTTVLTMTTLMTTTNSSMPKVSYIKAIDVYMIMSFVMVFASLLEYAAVGYLNKRMRMKKEKNLNKHPPLPIEFPVTLPTVPRTSGFCDPSTSSGMSSPSSQLLTNKHLECDCDLASFRPIRPIKMPKTRRHKGTTPSQIDKYSRMAFPIVFVVFNDGFTERDIRLLWAAGNMSVKVDNFRLATFELGDLMINETSATLSTGNYSRLRLTMIFARNVGFYFIQVYLPAMLVVVISWVAFWINRDSAPARTLLGITTVLTITTLNTSTNREMPHVSYVKAVDIYLGVSYIFVFSALLEFAAVSYSGKKDRDKKNRRTLVLKFSLPTLDSPDFVQANPGAETGETDALLPPCTCPQAEIYLPTPKHNPSLIDKYCRLGFPAAFAVFNAVYWVIYLKASQKSAV